MAEVKRRFCTQILVSLPVEWVFLNYVNISAGSFEFNYAHSGMYRGCLLLPLAFYGSLWVHGAPLWPCAHPAPVPVASPSAKRTDSQYVQRIFHKRQEPEQFFSQNKTELSLPLCLVGLQGSGSSVETFKVCVAIGKKPKQNILHQLCQLTAKRKPTGCWND